MTAMLAGRQPTIFGDGRQSRDFTFSTTWSTATCGRRSPGRGRKVLNVANGRNTLLDLISTLNRLSGNEDRADLRCRARIGDVRESLADISEARRAFEL